MIENITRVIVVKKGVHSYYNDLLTYLLSMTGLGSAVLAQRNKESIISWKYEGLFNIKGNKNVSGVQFDFRPFTLIDPIINNTFPPEIEIIESLLDDTEIENGLNVLVRVQASMIEASFTNYFERHKEQIKTKYGNLNNSWPSVWNFARIIRNTFSHGGVININNPNSPAVSWKGLSYDYTSNGHSIIFSDLSPVEIILLMEEMDTAL